ncbi:MAG: chemotaxis protein CheW [Hyphomonadaceae bacterium]
MTDTPSITTPALSARRRHALLGARTRRLARPKRETSAITTVSCLVCESAGGLYAIPLARIARVAPFRRAASTPSSNPALLGVTGLLGKLYHVFDLGHLMHAASPDAGGHLVLLRGGSAAVALRVAQAVRVAELIELSLEDASHMRPSHPAVTAFARPLQKDLFEGQTISILDPEQLTSRVVAGRTEGDASVDQ